MSIVKKFLDFIYPEDEIIGIDIGNYSIKFVLFSKSKSEIVLKSWGYTPLKVQSDLNQEEKKLLIASEISNFIKRNQIKVKYAATSVSGNSVIIRYIKIPQIDQKLLADKLYAEAESFIPFDVKDVYLSYYVINNNLFEEGQNKMEIVLVAAKKEIIDEKIEIIKEAGLLPVLIDVDSFALENLINQIEPRPETEFSGIMVVNIGYKVSNLSVLSDNIYFTKFSQNINSQYYSRLVRDIFVAGHSIDRGFSKKFGIKEEQADEFKKTMKILVSDDDKLAAINDFDRNLIIGSKILSNVVKELISDINRSLDFLSSSIPELNISKVYICGGASSFVGIDEYISRELKIPVKRLDPFCFVKNQPNNLPDYIRNSLCVAAGLSLRSIKDL